MVLERRSYGRIVLYKLNDRIKISNEIERNTPTTHRAVFWLYTHMLNTLMDFNAFQFLFLFLLLFNFFLCGVYL